MRRTGLRVAAIAAGEEGCSIDLPATIDPLVVGIGGSWDVRPAGYAHEFVNAPVRHFAFRSMMSTVLSSGRSLRDEVIAR